jgi:hypothetical protein
MVNIYTSALCNSELVYGITENYPDKESSAVLKRKNVKGYLQTSCSIRYLLFLVERRFVNIVRISGKLLILEIKIIKPFKND